MVFYRKYRPQTIEELDSEKVRTSLYSVLSSIDTPHAFLFTGPKGLGKTSSARIVAKLINCEERERNLKKKHIEPCNKCSNCISITNGSNIDIMEIDAASNRGIDEIRDLREKINLAPVTSVKKVYIIDEVHMLTNEAFNALLKTLEEPPAHVVFILATTEPHKVPETIISRCMHIHFSKATVEDIVRSLKRIVQGENIITDESVLKYIAKLADGGFRDAAKILEELSLIAGGEKLSLEVVENKYHIFNSGISVEKLLGLLEKKDIKNSLLLINQMVNEGYTGEAIISNLIERLHDMLLGLYGLSDTANKYKFDAVDISVLYGLFSQAKEYLRSSVVEQFPLELAVIAWCMDGKSSLDFDKDRIDIPNLRKKIGEMKKEQAISPPKPSSAKSGTESEETRKSSSLLSYSSDGSVSDEWIANFWNSLILEMKKYNHTISGVLRGCRLKSFTKEGLVIETSYEFHKDKLNDPKTLEALENAAKILTGNKMFVQVELKK